MSLPPAGIAELNEVTQSVEAHWISRRERGTGDDQPIARIARGCSRPSALGTSGFVASRGQRQRDHLSVRTIRRAP
jgi:hypothetical protein